MSAVPMLAKDDSETAPVCWQTSTRQGEPCAPDASVSPNPTAISASSVGDTETVDAAAAALFPSASKDTSFSCALVDRVCSTKLSSAGAISCTKTAILACSGGTPAMCRAKTALRLKSDAHTSRTAAPSSAALDVLTPISDSYRPAADMPARSSTFAEDRTTTRVAPAPGNAAAICAARSEGKSTPRMSARAASQARSTASGSPLAAAVPVAFAASRSASPSPAFSHTVSITPNGTKTPGGVLNSESERAATSCKSAHVAAFAPAVSVVARSRGWHSSLFDNVAGEGVGAGVAAAFASPRVGDAVSATAASAAVAARSVAPSGVTSRITSRPRSARAAACAAASSVAARGVFSCLARIARCERCGKSRASTTPLTCAPAARTSSSPSAVHASATTGPEVKGSPRLPG
mmetsp:Transcript_3234/g.13565  ORF Transcript_3234/g.13565 Transcript_3234/m.13565 type:complete len:407 (+) Transcript_3234:310-1530(+)